MKIPLSEITVCAKDLRYVERTQNMNDIYVKGQVPDFRFPPVLDVSVVYYRSGQDIFFEGLLDGVFEGNCSRCLRAYTFRLDKTFAFVLTPKPAENDKKSAELNREDLGFSFYSSDEINLSPLIQEQVLLALPTRPVCEENCRGLCSGCGANLNSESCSCDASSGDPRMAVFRALKLSH